MAGTASDVVAAVERNERDGPGRLAFAFLADGEELSEACTNAVLGSRVRDAGARLRGDSVAGERAIVVEPPGLSLIVALFGALRAGLCVTIRPLPRAERDVERLRAIAASSGATVAVGPREVRERLRLPELRWIALDEPSARRGSASRVEVDAGTPALLQYTSGSTAAPRGIVVTHGNLAENSRMIAERFEHGPRSLSVSWLPPYHDMGLVDGIVQPVWSGFPAYLMPPAAFLERPLRWLSCIARNRATHSGGPNFAYELCVERIDPGARAALDLRSWRVAYNGAEPVRATTVRRFADVFAPAGFDPASMWPCYGLAEATLKVTGGPRGAGPVLFAVDSAALEAGRAVADPAGRVLVGCGTAVPGVTVLVVDRERGVPAEEGIVGEIWVAGASVAAGYDGEADATRVTFGARLSDGRGPFLRTGDLGFLRGSELFVAGRLKDLVIVRGRNLHPQDLEATVESAHSSLRRGCCAVFAADAAGDDRVIAVQEIDDADPPSAGAALRAIQGAVAEQHEVQLDEVVLVGRGQVPKTTSGKVRRAACRALLAQGALQVVARSRPGPRPEGSGEGAGPRAIATRYFAERMQVALDWDRPMAEQGLDSLRAVELSCALQEAGLHLPPARLLDRVPPRDLAPERSALAPPWNGSEETPMLSEGQRALALLQKISPHSAAYNVPFATRVRGALDTAALAAALRQLLARHPALRTRIITVGGAQVPFVDPVPAAPLCVIEGGRSDAWLGREILRPFRLDEEPPFRAVLVRNSADDHVLLLVAHHVAVDLSSLTIIVRELAAVYADPASALPPIRCTPFRHARLQQELLASAAGERALQTVARRLEGVPPLEIPTDAPRQPVPSHRGGCVRACLDARLVAALRLLACESGATLSAVLLAGYAAVLQRYSRQSDFAIGVPASGRSHPDWSGTVGFLVNPVAVRVRADPRASFTTLLETVRAALVDALAGEEVPFVRVVERLQPRRDPARTPVFQALFAMQQVGDGIPGLAALALGEPGVRVQFGTLDLESVPLQFNAAAFDLALEVVDGRQGLGARLRYDADLFDERNCGAMLGAWEAVLRAGAQRPETAVEDLPLAESDRAAPMVEAMPPSPGLEATFAAQAERTPDRCAVACGPERVSYAALRSRAGQFARALSRSGIGRESLVAVSLNRRPDLVAALLGVRQAGAAFLPLDPAHPRGFHAAILRDARPSLLVTERSVRPALPAGIPALLAEEVQGAAVLAPADDAPEALAYVLYTSGSTGTPKGVAISRGSMDSFLRWAAAAYGPERLAGVVAGTAVTFDVSIFELFAPLLVGGSVLLVDDVLHLEQLPPEPAATMLGAVPSAMAEVLRLGLLPAGVRTINLAGEVLHPALVDELYARAQVGEVFDLYGPTEHTVYATRGLRRPRAMATIGTALAGTRLHLLDRCLRQVPDGAPGEILLAGTGQARGYWRQPAATAAAFVPDPFSLDGGRLYRTGDVARRLPDGSLQFLGRADRQVKIRGHRVEPEHVEQVIAAEPDVAGAVVAAIAGAAGDSRLCAWVLPRPGRRIELAALRSAVAARLPAAFLPDAWRVLDRMPLTVHGKLDRASLPPCDAALAPERPVVPPRTDVERRIAALWSELLGSDSVGANADFFALGGHSLLAARMLAQLRSEFGIDLSLRVVFERPTVAALAATIDAALAFESRPPRDQRAAGGEGEGA